MKIQIINDMIKSEDLQPKTSGSAGIDLKACIDITLKIYPGETFKFQTGIKAAFDPGWAGVITPRSSTGLRGLWLANVTGIIDSDYRGEIIVALKNTSDKPIIIKPLDRIAQLMCLPHYAYDYLEIVDSLDDTERSSGGFGSTGA